MKAMDRPRTQVKRMDKTELQTIIERELSRIEHTIRAFEHSTDQLNRINGKVHEIREILNE